MKTVSSIPTKSWQSIEHEEKGTIMKTDVFIKLFSDTYSETEMRSDIDQSFQLFRDFETRFSRFRGESELASFNHSSGGTVSQEFFFLLNESKRFYEETGGVFDPSVLPVLEQIGYKGNVISEIPTRKESFSRLVFDEMEQTVRKPRGLFIDLGGIGKGYIVDKVADKLSKKYTDGIVDAGGDMRVFGGDRDQHLDSFAIDVENSFNKTETSTTLILRDRAVATSGTNRRHWQYQGAHHHHIIDPTRATSAETDVVQVTVITSRAIEADVWAKTLLILGLEQGLVCAQEKNIPALFIGKDKKITRNSLFQQYEWKL